MNTSLSRPALRELLQQRNPHAIVGAADAARQRRHGRRVSFVANAHLDCSPEGRPWCPISGEAAPAGGFARVPEELPDAATQLLVLLPLSANAQDFQMAFEAVHSESSSQAPLPRTIQCGTASDWNSAFAATDLDAELARWRERGLSAISDGVWPSLHPALGGASALEWARFWRTAAGAGIRGQATVLYGPDFDLDGVFAQIDAIADLQRECSVFDAVSPVVYSRHGFAGAIDALATQASEDLRVLAACRLALEDVDHLRLYYECTDLKSAHTALLCGVDDLEGHLFLGERDNKADAESKDLSLSEMSRWLEETGLEAHLRNGLYQSRHLPMPSAAESS